MNVRSAMVAMLALAFVGVLARVGAGASAGAARITLAMLPPGTDVEQIADAVPGHRAGGDERRTRPRAGRPDLPRHRPGQPHLHVALPGFAAAAVRDRQPGPAPTSGRRSLARADGAPADIEPGLLAATLEGGRRRDRRPAARRVAGADRRRSRRAHRPHGLVRARRPARASRSSAPGPTSSEPSRIGSGRDPATC